MKNILTGSNVKVNNIFMLDMMIKNVANFLYASIVELIIDNLAIVVVSAADKSGAVTSFKLVSVRFLNLSPCSRYDIVRCNGRSTLIPMATNMMTLSTTFISQSK